jgi:hypothetical protein
MEISPEEEERLHKESELRKEVARQELDKASKPTLLSVSIILIFWALVIFGVFALFGIVELDIGGKPCAQYTIEEQFIACIESIGDWAP